MPRARAQILGRWLDRRRDLPIRVVKKYENWRLIEDRTARRAGGWSLRSAIGARAVKPGGREPVRTAPYDGAKARYCAARRRWPDRSQRRWRAPIEVSKRDGCIDTSDLWGVGQTEVGETNNKGGSNEALIGSEPDFFMITGWRCAGQIRRRVFPRTCAARWLGSAILKRGTRRGFLYLAGQLGIGVDGKPPDGIDAETKQALENIGAVLKRAGLATKTYSTAPMLSDMALWPTFNKVYVTHFPEGKRPARSAFGAERFSVGGWIYRALVPGACRH